MQGSWPVELSLDLTALRRGRDSQKALGLSSTVLERRRRRATSRPGDTGPLWTSRSWHCHLCRRRPRWEKAWALPRGAEEVGGAAGVPTYSFATDGTGSSLWWNYLCMLLIEPENKLKNDLLNWNWTELKIVYIFSIAHQYLEWNIEMKDKIFFSLIFLLGIGKKNSWFQLEL